MHQLAGIVDQETGRVPVRQRAVWGREDSMAQKASAYTFTSFDVPGAVNGTQGLQINNAGEVVGDWFDSNYVANPFLEYNGTITTFGVPNLSASFGIWEGEWINNAGEVVGNYLASDGTVQGFIENHGSVSQLAIPGAGNIYPVAINNSGEVLGSWSDSNGHEHVFVEKHGSITNLSLPAGASIFNAWGAINDAGEIVTGLYNGQDPPQLRY
jgi:hypothetical protein